MTFLEALRDEVTQERIESCLLWLLVFVHFYPVVGRRIFNGGSIWDLLKAQIVAAWGYFLLSQLCDAWSEKVNALVPEPYLDEVFHIPQASKYCEGRYYEWDDKITTPPGLYVLSVLPHRIWGLACTTSSLRRINKYGILLIAHFASTARHSLETRSTSGLPRSLVPSFYAKHTATNIALFPVLFFFSGLYYTDILSALVVLVAYQNHLKRLSREGGNGFINGVWTASLGVATLFMRQTNVFWAVIFMGGLEAVHVIKSLKPAKVERPQSKTLAGLVRFYSWRYSLGDVHDPPLDLARPIDWVFCVLSIAIATLCNPLRVLKQIWPHITIMGLFAGFVVWNGGVVLGDKSNHIATLHLMQMLYIWPLFAFFSAPLLLPSAVSLLGQLFQTVLSVVKGPKDGETSRPSVNLGTQGDVKERNQPKQNRNGSAPTTSASFALASTEFLCQKASSPIFFLGGIILSLAIIKYNTIVHPFTLADNRHYMFYIFRYTILRSTKVRFSLLGAYALSAWLVWNRLAGCPPAAAASSAVASSNRSEKQGTPVPFISTPFPSAEMLDGKGHSETPPSTRNAQGQGSILTLDNPSSVSTTPPQTSTALLWLLTTSLSLITAPLVEPRYFILPWVFWRLLVPAWRAPEQLPHHHITDRFVGGLLRRLGGRKFDLTVVLETVWFLIVNVATMYVFLRWPYVWKGEDGAVLDGGRVQRFMW